MFRPRKDSLIRMRALIFCLLGGLKLCLPLGFFVDSHGVNGIHDLCAISLNY